MTPINRSTFHKVTHICHVPGVTLQWILSKGGFIFLRSDYPDGMDTSLTLSTRLTRHRGLALILTVGKARAEITELIAELVLRGPLFIVAASEWLPAYELARVLRKRTIKVREILDHLYAARASTCYRLVDSLGNLPSNGEPILVLDFLHTFYDTNVPLDIRLRKLRECCRELKRLAFYRPVILMTQVLSIEDYEKFIPALCSIADTTLTLETETEQIKQPVLF